MGAGPEDSGLLHLLKASSKAVVIEVCNRLMAHVSLSDDDVTFLKSKLSLNESEAKDLMTSLKKLLSDAIYTGNDDAASLKALFPENFHSDLQNMLVKIIVDNFSKWKTCVINEQVSLPKLTEFSWAFNKDDVIPSCVLQLKTSDESTINVEMNKETLDTMLDSLTKIRDQISSVTQ